MSGRIPQNFIDELLTRVDIVEVIGGHVPLKKKGREYSACCPFHSEKTPSFTVSPDKQFYHCFGCGAHGTALGFIMEYEHVEFVEAVEALAQIAGMGVPREAGRERHDYQELYDLLARARDFYCKTLRNSPQAINYLKQRGVSGETAKHFQIGFAPDAFDGLITHIGAQHIANLQKAGLVAENDRGNRYDKFRNRIIFPIRDRRGRTIAFGGRALGDATPKYLNSPETPLFHKGEVLYGLYESRQTAKRPEFLLLVEGYMDVVMLAEHGIHNAVATLGTATSQPHLQQMYRQSQEIIFCFDGDRAGREAAWRACEQLLPIYKDGLQARFMFLEQGEDPDSLVQKLGAAAFNKTLETALPLSEYIFEHQGQDVDTTSMEGAAQLAQRIKPLITRLPEGVFRQLMATELESRLGVGIQIPSAAQKPAAQQQKSATNTTTGKKSTAIRNAIRLMLNQPSLATRIRQLPSKKDVDLPGLDLLIEILETIESTPDLTSGALVEHFRGTEYYRHLLKLLQWSPPVGFHLEDEFDDAIDAIQKWARKQRQEMLIRKGRITGLSPYEEQELHQLLQSS